MAQAVVKIGDSIQRAFDLYKANLVLLAVSTLLMSVVAAFSLGILSGPMYVGLLLIVLRLVDGDTEKPQIGDLFKGFSYFVDSFLYFLVWGLAVAVVCGILAATCVGIVVAIPLAIAAGTFLAFGPFLIAEKNMAFWPASQESARVVKTNFWPFCGLVLVASLIGSVGGYVPYLGVLLVYLTLPMTPLILAFAYRDAFNGASVAPAEAPEAAPPPAAEPAPGAPSDAGDIFKKQDPSE